MSSLNSDIHVLILIGSLSPKEQPEAQVTDTCGLVSQGFCNRDIPYLFEIEFWDPALSYSNVENTKCQRMQLFNKFHKCF